jgi:hypothetical protein
VRLIFLFPPSSGDHITHRERKYQVPVRETGPQSQLTARSCLLPVAADAAGGKVQWGAGPGAGSPALHAAGHTARFSNDDFLVTIGSIMHTLTVQVVPATIQPAMHGPQTCLVSVHQRRGPLWTPASPSRPWSGSRQRKQPSCVTGRQSPLPVVPLAACGEHCVLQPRGVCSGRFSGIV